MGKAEEVIQHWKLDDIGGLSKALGGSEKTIRGAQLSIEGALGHPKSIQIDTHATG